MAAFHGVPASILPSTVLLHSLSWDGTAFIHFQDNDYESLYSAIQSALLC
ncbi:uncharacterized protein MYCFIDRAFT_176490 [Pseudocercospora fijiensis CIRAD86]|uniref:Uncharacterized protein n=1 Tax=Pseudocercospora fijiensis (strain CIRAD86) TaxID=383855 RepID=M3AVM5_PSEFD|nr:uncharacterized protein MYCFIDRAFT_176490 [Pseudocercospora fijiensis CIRAD86]EME81188.1 hypothetical protein MYCFIDRAFT_176490 [Pseudocercospora fijiensis CIRAD86]